MCVCELYSQNDLKMVLETILCVINDYYFRERISVVPTMVFVVVVVVD